MFKYTLCFIIYQNQVLLLNRNKAPWMGRWNGVGGKIEGGEDKLFAIKREIEEETSLNPEKLSIQYRGIITWNNEENNKILGLHLFVGYLNGKLPYQVPHKTPEGILDLKPLEWVSNPNNIGLADNIPYFFPKMIDDDNLYEYYCHFENGQMVDVKVSLMK